MALLTDTRFTDLYKQLMLTFSEIKALEGDEAIALELKEMGLHAEGFSKFELEIDYDVDFPEHFEPKHGSNVRTKIVPR